MTCLTRWAGCGQADSFCLPILRHYAPPGDNFAYLEQNACSCEKSLQGCSQTWKPQEAAEDSEQFVPTKTLPAQGLLDFTAWHCLSPNSQHNWKFLRWHIFIGSVWYFKRYESYGSTLGFSKISLPSNNKMKPISTDPVDEIRYVFRSQAKSLLMLTGIPCLGMFVNLNSPPLLCFFNLPTSCLP